MYVQRSTFNIRSILWVLSNPQTVLNFSKGLGPKKITNLLIVYLHVTEWEEFTAIYEMKEIVQIFPEVQKYKY